MNTFGQFAGAWYRLFAMETHLNQYLHFLFCFYIIFLETRATFQK